MTTKTSQYQRADELNQLQLGKSTEYISHYSPNLLQGVARSLNRDALALNADNLPFIGEDVWYGYEISWLNNKGKPVVAVGEFRFPYHSPAIVESKSFKLYLNSFNQSKFETTEQVKTTMERDLSQVAGAQASVSLFPVDNCPALNIESLTATCIDDIDIEIDHYDLDAELLQKNKTNNKNTDEHLVSHLLKSNCLITNQPDWASVYIHYQGEQICHQSLLKYLISFRQHNEFHEQCVERIFIDLLSAFNLDKLTVFARYTRRGGLDINPFRSTHLTSAPFARTLRQ